MKNALKSVKYPGFTRDIVSFGLVKSVEIENGEVKVQIALATNDPNVPAAIKSEAEKVLQTIDGVQSAKVLIDIHAPPAGAGTGMGATRIPGIRHVIAVASGKQLPIGLVLVVMNNTSASPINGSFVNFPEGGKITSGRNTYQASYVGGDGNDMTLTVVAP